MISTFAVFLCTMTMAAAALPSGMTAIDIKPMVSVTERLVVISRTHTTDTTYRCHSAKEKSSIGDNKYIYNLKARNSALQYISGEVTVQLEEIPGEANKYRATYTNQQNTKHTLTLLQKDEHLYCFVLYVEKSTGQQGCELLTTVAYKDQIPPACQQYFKKQCTGAEAKLYLNDCTYD
uniref:Lipocalin/cytosolic fatty-acid binding domain-containing protein n=1 Tax=Amblyomma maculatum TaxID=34609 RepID=G3MS33_AMBMU